ncbi:MAG: hypothetical protein R6U39_09025 [Candidatus Aegiribacteria sp.]
MDSTLKQMLESFRFSVENYTSTIGSNNEKLKKARELVDSLWRKAEDGADMTAISMDPQFSQVATLIGELASEPQLSPEEMESQGLDESIPPASIPAAGYHMAYDSMQGANREKQAVYYERIFEIERQAKNAIHFNTMLEEDGVLLEMSREPLMETARRTLEQARDAHSPTVDHQQKLTAEVYARVKTIPELEYEGTRMAEFSNVEHQWDALYLEVIGLLPACAQAIESFGPGDEAVAKLRNSHRFMADFMGITWDRVFQDRRYLLFWNEVFWPRIPPPKRLARGVTSAEGWRDMLKKRYYDPFVKDEPPVEDDPSRARVRFWRRDFPVGDVLELLQDPPRPEVVRR